MSDIDYSGVPCRCGSKRLGVGHILGQPLYPSPVRISSGIMRRPETVREEIHTVDVCTIWKMVAEVIP